MPLWQPLTKESANGEQHFLSIKKKPLQNSSNQKQQQQKVDGGRSLPMPPQLQDVIVKKSARKRSGRGRGKGAAAATGIERARNAECQEILDPSVSSKGIGFCRRPGFGQIGTRCLVKANHFLAQFPHKDLVQYDVTILVKVCSRSLNRAIIAKLTICCMAERVVGHVSFRIVFQDNCLESGETMAIKRIFKTKGMRLGNIYCDPLMTPRGHKIALRQRWAPTPVQLQILESIFDQGNGTPSLQKIKEITQQLIQHSQISKTNVYNWFRNRRARSKQKQTSTLPSNTESETEAEIESPSERKAISQKTTSIDTEHLSSDMQHYTSQEPQRTQGDGEDTCNPFGWNGSPRCCDNSDAGLGQANRYTRPSGAKRRRKQTNRRQSGQTKKIAEQINSPSLFMENI